MRRPRTLSVAIAILVAYVTNNWWFFVTVIVLEMGLLLLITGLIFGSAPVGHGLDKKSRESVVGQSVDSDRGTADGEHAGRRDSPSILIVVFLIWMAAFALLFASRRKPA